MAAKYSLKSTMSILSEVIPGAEHDADLRGVLQSETQRISHPGEPLLDTEVKAAENIVNWYKGASEDLALIRRIGLARFVIVYLPGRTWATLQGLKAQGITELPL